MTAADLLADDEFAPREIGEHLLDRLLARECETFAIRPLRWMRTGPQAQLYTVREVAELARQIAADPHLNCRRTVGQIIGSLIDDGRLSYLKLAGDDFETIVRLYATQDPPPGAPDG